MYEAQNVWTSDAAHFARFVPRVLLSSSFKQFPPIHLHSQPRSEMNLVGLKLQGWQETQNKVDFFFCVCVCVCTANLRELQTKGVTSGFNCSFDFIGALWDACFYFFKLCAVQLQQLPKYFDI